MARSRRIRSLLWLVVLLVALLLLLEMNRWIPGSWPGGGGGGIRPVAGGGPDASRVREPEERPPDRPASPPERIEVRGPDGSEAQEWTVVTAGGAPEAHGFALASAAGQVLHGPSPFPGTGPWVAVPPEGPLPPTSAAAPRPPRRLTVRVVDPATGADLPNPIAFLVTRDGQRSLLGAQDGRPGLEADLADHLWEGAAVEAGALGRPVRRVPVSGPEVRVELPLGRIVIVEAFDETRTPVPDATVETRYPLLTEGAPEPSDAVVGRYSIAPPGRGPSRFEIPLPEGAPGTLRIGAPGRAPVVKRLTAADGSAPVEVILERGIPIRVRVTEERGTPVPGARVIVEASVEGVQHLAEGTTGPDGTAVVGHFGAGPVEVYASAPGFAWGRARGEALSAGPAIEVRLSPGRPLRLVVESPDGRPLEGVRVHLTPSEGPPEVSPPSEEPLWTDARGAAEVPALPDRPYVVRLSLPGHSTATLREIRPGETVWFATLVRSP